MTSPEQDLTDRLAQSEKDRASWLHQHNVLAERVRELEAERDDLARWKREMLTVTQWWDEIDAFIRKHPDAPLGLNVSHIALEWLKERDEIKAYLATRVIVEVNDGTFAAVDQHVKDKLLSLKHDLASARFAATNWQAAAEKLQARITDMEANTP